MAMSIWSPCILEFTISVQKYQTIISCHLLLNNWDVTGIDTDNMFYDANSMDIANYPNGYSS